VTGNSQGFEHHSQRGTCLKGSRIEVELEESKYWLAAKAMAKRYEITLQAIIASNKFLGNKPLSMPRLVKDLDGYTPIIRTGFGKGLYGSNRVIQGDRQGPKFMLMTGTCSSERCQENARRESIEACPLPTRMEPSL
jgi:hypothetical protein